MSKAAAALNKKEQKARHDLALRLLAGETRYVQQLQSVISAYMEPLLVQARASAASSAGAGSGKGHATKTKSHSAALSETEVHIVFDGLVDVVHAHEELLRQIRMRVTGLELRELSSERLVAGLRHSFRNKSIPATCVELFEAHAVSGAVVAELDEEGWVELFELLGIENAAHRFALRKWVDRDTWRRAAGSAGRSTWTG